MIEIIGTSLVVQWLKLCAPNKRADGLTSGWGTKIPYSTQHGQKINILKIVKKKKERKKETNNKKEIKTLRRVITRI